MVHLRHCLLCIATVASAGASVAQGREAVPKAGGRASIMVLDDTVFYSDPYRAISIDIAAKLSPKWHTRIPFRSAQFAMAELPCGGVTSSGVLSGCKVTNIEPKGAGYEPVAAALTTALKTTKANARRLGSGIDFILVQVRLSNSDVEPWRGPCWPPICSITPAPPPPPSLPPGVANRPKQA